MRVSAAVSTESSPVSAAEEAAASVAEDLGGKEPDLAFLFLSSKHARAAEDVLSIVRSALSPVHLIGCSAAGVLGGGREYEGGPAVSLWAGSFPEAEIQSFCIRSRETSEGLELSGVPVLPEGPSSLILLGDPFTFPADLFVEALGEAHPETQIVGGMASSAHAPGGNRLFCNTETVDAGAVAVSIASGLDVRPVVSQGCRPFGPPMVITRAQGPVIFELGGKPALDRLCEEANELSAEDRSLLYEGLHIGRAIDASQVRGSQGDFLVRNVTELDKEKGTITVTDPVRPGQTVRFHLRDPSAASEELQMLLRETRAGCAGPPAGSLLFTCNGRGRHMFSVDDHDTQAMQDEFGSLPVAGFFAAGEIGPVGRRSYLHGFTAVAAFFLPDDGRGAE